MDNWNKSASNILEIKNTVTKANEKYHTRISELEKRWVSFATANELNAL